LEVSTECKKDVDDNITFYVLCILLGESVIFGIQDLNLKERRGFINYILYQTYGVFFLVSLFRGACGIPYLCHANCVSFLFFNDQFV